MTPNSPKARLIAFYLPQFHPIPENDKWWEKGFTEWTNVTKAQPLYKGHYQPNLPSELGFYDLRVPETRIEQAELAREYGIEGFCYWHYWFGNGKRLLERPFQEVLKTKKPNFPFCLGWANETWSGIWHGKPNRILIEQQYPGEDDYKKHFYSLIEAFEDERYLTINNKKIFVVYRPQKLPEPKKFIEIWRELADKEGIGELFFVGVAQSLKPIEDGFDGIVSNAPGEQVKSIPKKIKEGMIEKIFFPSRQKRMPQVYEYADLVESYLNNFLPHKEFPIIIPNWDNTPRSGTKGIVLENSSPQLFGKMLKKAVKTIQNRNFQNRVIFIKSWNEWAEGNYLEPSRQFGRGYLEIIKEKILTDEI